MSDRTVAPPRFTASDKSRYLDPARLTRAVALTAWSGFFVWLWVSGEMSRYLGPRTYWVIPFGAVVLGGAALMQLSAIKAPVPRPGLTRAEMLSAALLLAPLFAVLAVPDADLGSLAASRKSTPSGVSAAEALAPPVGDPVDNPSFRDITYAEESTGYADAIGVADGTETQLVGFVDEAPESPPGTFTLTRFYVSCCAADAIPFSVAVDPGAEGSDLADDQWAEVEGTLERRGDRFVLVARQLEAVPEPEDPYLY